MKVRVTLDEKTCIGCGACTMCDNYEMYQVEGMPKARVKESISDDVEGNRDAEDNCPVNCIHVEDLKE